MTKIITLKAVKRICKTTTTKCKFCNRVQSVEYFYNMLALLMKVNILMIPHKLLIKIKEKK